jgi:hypothetical protein
MDEKRQRRAQNAAESSKRSRAGAADASLRADRPAAGERPPKLGEILVAQGKITQEQLAVALERQKTSGRRLGEELIKAGFVKRAVISQALRMQRRIVYGAMTVLAVTTIVPDGNAAVLQNQIAMTAFVPAQTVGKVVQQSAEITITDADIARPR